MTYPDSILINAIGIIAGLYAGVILINLGIIMTAFVLHKIGN